MHSKRIQTFLVGFCLVSLWNLPCFQCQDLLNVELSGTESVDKILETTEPNLRLVNGSHEAAEDHVDEVTTELPEEDESSGGEDDGFWASDDDDSDDGESGGGSGSANDRQQSLDIVDTMRALREENLDASYSLHSNSLNDTLDKVSRAMALVDAHFLPSKKIWEKTLGLVTGLDVVVSPECFSSYFQGVTAFRSYSLWAYRCE